MKTDRWNEIIESSKQQGQDVKTKIINGLKVVLRGNNTYYFKMVLISKVTKSGFSRIGEGQRLSSEFKFNLNGQKLNFDTLTECVEFIENKLT